MRFDIVLALDGMVWSSVAALFVPYVTAMLLASAICIAAVGVFILISSYRTAALSTVVMLLPLIVCTLWFGFDNAEILVGGISIFSVVLLQESWRSHLSWTEMIRLRLQSDSVAAEREQSRLLAVEASHAKPRFLANMSHELRSPLNAVIGAAQLRKAGERDPQQQEQLIDAIQRSGSNLLGLR